MARVGTCQACGARFKVPETTKATRAKCSKCGGVVQIPPMAAPAVSRAPAREPPAPAARGGVRKSGGAPARRAAPAPAPAAGARKDRGLAADSDAGGAPAPGRRDKSTGRARGAGRASARRGAASGGSAEQQKQKPVLLFVLVGVLVLGAGAWFAFFQGGDDTPAGDGSGSASEAATDAGDAPGNEAVSEDSAAEGQAGLGGEPAVIETPDPDLIESGAPDTAGGAAPAPAAAPAAQAPEPVSSEPVSSGPLDPVLAFEPVGLWPDVDQAQHDEWANLVHAYFMEGKNPRERKALREQLDAVDAIDSSPAYINCLIGLDMSDDIQVRNAFELVAYWQERVAKVPKFSFLDFTRMQPDDIDKRVKVVLAWKEWAETKIANPDTIEKYRLDVAAALAEAASGDG
jgi:hypothetical protein